MLTGRQLKAARALLGIPRSKLAERMSIPSLTIKIAESSDDECLITIARAHQVRSYLERQGIEFLPVGSEPAVQLVGVLERRASMAILRRDRCVAGSFPTKGRPRVSRQQPDPAPRTVKNLGPPEPRS